MESQDRSYCQRDLHSNKGKWSMICFRPFTSFVRHTAQLTGREAAHVGRIARAASEALLDLRFVSLLYPFVKYAAAAQPTRKGNAVPTTPIGPRPSPCETLHIDNVIRE